MVILLVILCIIIIKFLGPFLFLSDLILILFSIFRTLDNPEGLRLLTRRNQHPQASEGNNLFYFLRYTSKLTALMSTVEVCLMKLNEIIYRYYFFYYYWIISNFIFFVMYIWVNIHQIPTMYSRKKSYMRMAEEQHTAFTTLQPQP